MQPTDVVYLGLLIQALALGHGSVQVAYERMRPRWWWLPLALVVGYYVFVFLVPPPGVHPPKPGQEHAAWLNAFRYLTQVFGFSLTIEALLYVLRHQRNERRTA